MNCETASKVHFPRLSKSTLSLTKVKCNWMCYDCLMFISFWLFLFCCVWAPGTKPATNERIQIIAKNIWEGSIVLLLAWKQHLTSRFKYLPSGTGHWDQTKFVNTYYYFPTCKKSAKQRPHSHKFKKCSFPLDMKIGDQSLNTVQKNNVIYRIVGGHLACHVWKALPRWYKQRTRLE